MARKTDVRTLLPVLMYHSIGTDAGRAFRRWQVSLPRFTAQIAALAAVGYRPTSLSAALGDPHGRNVAITFDDGLHDNLQVLAVLRSMDASATFYIPTAYVGGTASWLGRRSYAKPRMLDWRDLEKIVDAGHEVGAHGNRHSELDILPYDEVLAEAVTSRDLLVRHCGPRISSFCYPYGYNTQAVRSAVIAAGYKSACEVGYRIHSYEADPFKIGRLLVGEWTGDADIEKLVTLGQRSIGSRVRAHTRTLWRGYRRVRRQISVRMAS